MNNNKTNTTEIKNVREIEQIALMIRHTKRGSFTPLKGKDLELDEILSICAQVWDVPKETIKQKIQHNKYDIKVKQLSFLWAASYYSNESQHEIAAYMPCQVGTVRKAVNLANIAIDRKDGEYPELLKIIAACEERCPGRIKSNFKVGLEFNGLYIGDEDCRPFKLTQYQVNTIPIQELSWFLKRRMKAIYAYKKDEDMCRFVFTDKKDQAEHLFMLQSFGYRFTANEGKEREIIEMHHPICDKCVKKNGCPFRGRGKGLFNGTNFRCFSPLGDIEMKIAIELLYPLEKYQLQ